MQNILCFLLVDDMLAAVMTGLENGDLKFKSLFQFHAAPLMESALFFKLHGLSYTTGLKKVVEMYIWGKKNYAWAQICS